MPVQATNEPRFAEIPSGFLPYFLFPSFTSFACGNSHFENSPQLLQAGDTEQLAVTFLFTKRYPAEVVIPPSNNNLPPVLKKSFRFIILSRKAESGNREKSGNPPSACPFYLLFISVQKLVSFFYQNRVHKYFPNYPRQHREPGRH